MGDSEKGNIDLLRSLQTLSNNQLLANSNLDVPQLNLSQFQGPVRQNLFSAGSENGRWVAGIPHSHPQMPPVSPYSQIQLNRPAGQQMNQQRFGHSPFHARSLSQPPVFSFNSSPGSGPGSIFVDHPENHDGGSSSMLSSLLPSVGGGGSPSMANREGLPPRKLHRRSVSEVPFGLNNALFQSPPLPPVGPHGSHGGLQRTLSGGPCVGTANAAQLVNKEIEKKPDVESMDDLLKAYMNFDNIDVLNSGGANEKNDNENREDMDSRASNSKTKGSDSSDNDAESSANETGCSGQGGMRNVSPGNQKEGLKRSAGGDIAPTVRHQRSISMDSFMGKLQLNDNSPNQPPSAAGALAGQVLVGEHSRTLGLEFHDGMFTGSELEKIMANEKLAEIVRTDPKRVKRILANRQSAARSKERKMRYITELEHQVQTLQNEATALSAQLTMLQNDSLGLTTLNTELKLRLLALEQQAQLRDALNDALSKEIHRLRIVTGELADRTRESEPVGLFNFHMLQQQLPTTSAQELSNSSVKSESNSSH